MESPCQSAISQAEATPRQAAVDRIDSHDEPSDPEISAFGSDWKRTFLYKLRDFLITRSIEE